LARDRWSSGGAAEEKPNWRGVQAGDYSLKALAKKAYEEGFRFRKSGKKIPISTLHKILRKRIYTGDFDYAGVTYHGHHEL
jgi:site-specific DNA recombinase